MCDFLPPPDLGPDEGYRCLQDHVITAHFKVGNIRAPGSRLRKAELRISLFCRREPAVLGLSFQPVKDRLGIESISGHIILSQQLRAFI